MAANGRRLGVGEEPVGCASLAHGLAEAGCVVTDAGDGNDAIAPARSRRPARALPDLRWRGQSGFDAAESRPGVAPDR